MTQPAPCATSVAPDESTPSDAVRTAIVATATTCALVAPRTLRPGRTATRCHGMRLTSTEPPRAQAQSEAVARSERLGSVSMAAA